MLPRLKGQMRLQSTGPLSQYSPTGGGSPFGGSVTPPAVYTGKRRREACFAAASRVRNCSFSRRHPSPQDTSQSSLKRRSQSISTCLQRYRTQRLETVRVVQMRERKKHLAKLLRKRYGIKFSRWEQSRMSEDQMTRRAVEKRGWTLARLAAKRMVRWLSRVRMLRGLHEAAAREHMSAFLIQQYWRRFQVRCMQACVVRPRAEAVAQEKAAVLIQKCFRGYVTRQRTLKARALQQVNAIHFHCERIRMRPLIEQAPVILRTWQSYRKRKKEVEEKKAEALRQAAATEALQKQKVTERPSKLTIVPPNMRKMKSESYAPRSPLTRTPLVRKRSQTDDSLPAKRQSPKLRSNRRGLSPEEPKTAPMHLQGRTRHPKGRDLERIEEIS